MAFRGRRNIYRPSTTLGSFEGSFGYCRTEPHDFCRDEPFGSRCAHEKFCRFCNSSSIVRLSSDHGRIMVESSSIGGSTSVIFGSNLELSISWQVLYFAKVEGDSQGGLSGIIMRPVSNKRPVSRKVPVPLGTFAKGARPLGTFC